MKVGNTIVDTFNNELVCNVTDLVFNSVEITGGYCGCPDKEQDRKQ